jgi:hypothetical protein
MLAVMTAVFLSTPIGQVPEHQVRAMPYKNALIAMKKSEVEKYVVGRQIDHVGSSIYYAPDGGAIIYADPPGVRRWYWKGASICLNDEDDCTTFYMNNKGGIYEKSRLSGYRLVKFVNLSRSSE